MVAGFLLKEILDRFTNKTLSILQPDRKMWIYSAHDLNIVSILNALNLYKVILYFFFLFVENYSFQTHFQFDLPPYASSLYFELYNRGSKYYVQLYYRNSNEENPPPLEIPNCGKFCPLEEFYELYKDLLPTEYETHDMLCKL